MKLTEKLRDELLELKFYADEDIIETIENFLKKNEVVFQKVKSAEKNGSMNTIGVYGRHNKIELKLIIALSLNATGTRRIYTKDTIYKDESMKLPKSNRTTFQFVNGIEER